MFFWYIRAGNCLNTGSYLMKWARYWSSFSNWCHRQQGNENISPHSKPSFYRPDKNLSMGHFSVDRAEMPLYTHLLALCGGCIEETWAVQRNLAGAKANQPLSSLGRKRLRSRALKKDFLKTELPGHEADSNLSATFFQFITFQKAARYSALLFWYFR